MMKDDGETDDLNHQLDHGPEADQARDTTPVEQRTSDDERCSS
jgi:hypothetical protein